MSSTSTRALARRLSRALNRDKGTLAWVGNPDGSTVNVPGTSNQIYVRIGNDINQTHPAFSNGYTLSYDDVVWCENRRGDWWVIGEYTFTP